MKEDLAAVEEETQTQVLAALKRYLATVKKALIHSKRRSLKTRRRVSVLGPQVRATSAKKRRTLGSFS